MTSEKAYGLTDNSAINFLSSLCPCFSAILAGSSPYLFVILQAHVASGQLSRNVARFFNPNLAAQWRRVGNSSKLLSVYGNKDFRKNRFAFIEHLPTSFTKVLWILVLWNHNYHNSNTELAYKEQFLQLTVSQFTYTFP